MSSEHDSHVVQVRDLFKQLDRIASRADRFGWEHPATVSVLASAEAAFVDALERSPRALRIDVKTSGFTLDDFDVWVPPAPLEGAPASLLASGIARVTILPGMRAPELRAWVGIMVSDRAGKLAPDDDVRTALWDAALAHVRFEIADEAQVDPQRRMPVAVTIDPGPIDRALRAACLRELIAERALPSAMKLVDTLISDFANDTPEAHARLRERVREAACALIARGELAHLIDVHDAARLRTLESGSARAAAAKSIETAIFEGEAFPAVLEFLRSAPNEVHRSVPILDRIDASRIGDVLVALRAGAAGELRAALEKFVERAARGHEAEVARAVVDAPRDVAVHLLAVLARVQTSAAAAEISRLALHGDEDVRLDARLLGASDRDRVADEIVQMIDAPDPRVRAVALRAIGRHELLGAIFALLRRLRAPTFADLPIEEQRELLRALLRLSPEQGEAISLEILRTGGMFQSDAREATRLVAVELLGELGVSHGATDALRDVARTHWGASRAMRDAAERAARAMDDRVSHVETESNASSSSIILEAPIDRPREEAHFDFSPADRRASHAAASLEIAARAAFDPSIALKLPLMKRASQALADLREADLARCSGLLISEGAHRDQTKFGALAAALVAGAMRQLGAPPNMVAETAFAAIECEVARAIAKSNSADAIVASASFGRLDEPASRRVIVAVESLVDADPSANAPSIQSMILAEARRFGRVLAGHASIEADDVVEVVASLLARATTPRERLVVQLVVRSLDPPMVATARGTLAVTPFVHLLAYMLDHRASGSIELVSPNDERSVVIFRNGTPVFVHPHSDSVALDALLVALGGLSAETKYVFYKDVELVERIDAPVSFRGDLCLALAAARAWPDHPRMERMLARIAHRRLVLHPHARVEGLDATDLDRDVIAALQRGVRLPEIRSAHPDALHDVDALIYVLAVMRQLSLPGQHGEPIGSEKHH